MSDLPINQVNARQGHALAPQQRESMAYDVVIVGAGPAGLSAAIRLKQRAQADGRDISVCVVEKGAEIGAHILSGAVLDTSALNRLLPDWRAQGAPVTDSVKHERFMLMTRKAAYTVPHFLLPPFIRNRGNYIISLGQFTRWLAERAENLGVEIYAGFAAAEILFNDAGAVCGIATGDMGVSKTGEKKSGWTAGVELHAKYTFLAEGVRGSLSKAAIEHFKLAAHADYQKYSLGIKELWRVPADQHKAGYVQHTLGWPLDNATTGGSWLYHFGADLVSIGFVVHLNYQNPYLSPYDEFQRFKTHPAIRKILQNGERVAYGARAISSGGVQSVPKLAFAGGALLGCAAGFVNVARLKGIHNAMESGMLAADAAFDALAAGREYDTLAAYQSAYERSAIYKELKKARNVKPLLAKCGTFFGTILASADMWLRALGLGLPFTLSHARPDHKCLKKAALCKKIAYPKPDGVVSFDKMSSVYLSSIHHEEDQPVHLTLQDENVPVSVNLPDYDEPAQLYCPAGVYEIVHDANGAPRLQINAPNCVHCKTCDIKCPSQNINWVVPEGGNGPNYPNM